MNGPSFFFLFWLLLLWGGELVVVCLHASVRGDGSRRIGANHATGTSTTRHSRFAGARQSFSQRQSGFWAAWRWGWQLAQGTE